MLFPGTFYQFVVRKVRTAGWIIAGKGESFLLTIQEVADRREKAKVVAAVWGTYYPFSSKDDLKETFWKNILFERVVVWYGVNQKIIHYSEALILPSGRSSIHPFLQFILVRHGIELILSPK